MKWFIIIALLVLFFGFIAPAFVLSYVIYSAVLVRTKPEKWSREISISGDDEIDAIYADGKAWGDKNGNNYIDVSIESDGFKLVGEYFDFGNDKAVIIIPGRMEGCKYSYHFAKPYQDAGFNVLAIDNRSHGLSEGKYNSLGFKEHHDIINWAKFLHEEYGVKNVVLHGICIGSSTALFALTSKDCPEYLSAMTADGMYETFYQSFKNHMVEQKRPLFPFLYIVMLYIKLCAGANVVTDGPIKRIDNMKKPILFIHSKVDIYSVPEKTVALYDRCPSENKHIEWFDKGGHSKVRINNIEKYDKTIVDFYNNLGL